MWVLAAELSLSSMYLDGSSGSRFESQDDAYRTRIDRLFSRQRPHRPCLESLACIYQGWLCRCCCQSHDCRHQPECRHIVQQRETPRVDHGNWCRIRFSHQCLCGLQYDYIMLEDKNHSALGVSNTGLQQHWVGNIDTGGLHAITARINYRF